MTDGADYDVVSPKLNAKVKKLVKSAKATEVSTSETITDSDGNPLPKPICTIEVSNIAGASFASLVTASCDSNSNS